MIARRGFRDGSPVTPQIKNTEDLEHLKQAAREWVQGDPPRKVAKTYQDGGLLTLVVVFDADWLDNDSRFTEEEVADAIKDINEYGDGFGDLTGDRKGISTTS